MARAAWVCLIQAVTTNRNRIVGEFRHLISKNGGNLAETGAVGWMFHRKGEIVVPKEQATEDKMLDLVLEAGADDLKDDGSGWYVVTPPEALDKVKEALTKAGITPASAEIGMVSPELHQADGVAGDANGAAGGSVGRARWTCSMCTRTSISMNRRYRPQSARTNLYFTRPESSSGRFIGPLYFCDDLS